MVGNTLHGVIRRRELSAPPVPLEEVSTYPDVFPLYKQKDGPYLHTGKKGVRFPVEGFVGTSMAEANDLMALSFSKGVRRNLVFYLETFVDRAQRNSNTIKDFRESLHAVLLAHARPTLTLTVHNAGGTAVVFRPYFGLAVLGKEGLAAVDTYLMVPTSQRANADTSEQLFQRVLTGGDRQAPTRVRVTPYLPEVGALAYTTLSPGATQTLTLVATSDLGDKGPQYRASYESGLLRTRLLAITISGQPVWSETFVFGANVNEESKKTTLFKVK
jgi:hypothetical protein